ncbi:PREDICTED: aromatic-L-amino-acid decarboxylase-like [Nicrophorus vespilloides]|uniref:Aromatic-L-amino-acid decarboxylase-like n=1 Tax=Nicrophorus vespilloides TaxID=110193 RepID=A0ABM1MQN0_NICVS|nr:PREDICTED: aromatic-L-amino-acid decarboxylase-like [Nicrophorus vespilloides]
MDSTEFREFGKAAVDFIADYFDTIRDRDVLPSIKPGYLRPLVQSEVPQQGEKWQDILKDMDRVILPGITHWHSPNFHAYYPTANSYPAIVGEMMSAGLGVVGFNWIASPACTELEVVMMDWLGKLLELPKEFLNESEGPGGGVIQGSASEATLIGLLAAKERVVRRLMAGNSNMTESEIKGKLVAYSSDQSNSSVEKAGLIGSMIMRLLPSDDKGRLTGKILTEAIEKDKKSGLIPCYVIATLGTTPTCAFDDLQELGTICNEGDIWMHVDAAYAGAAFTCPEYRYLMKGVEMAESFNFNPHKWLLVNFDCSALWVKNAKYLVEAFNVERIYLQHKHTGVAPDYLHWQIPLGRKFRSLKIWFTMRTYGVEGIQKHIRGHIELAKYFESLVKQDERFEVTTSSLGLVCFRLHGDNNLTQLLHDKLNNNKKIFTVPCKFRNKFVIRFVITSRLTEHSDIDFAWKEITSLTEQIVSSPCLSKQKISHIQEMNSCEKVNGRVEKSK